MIATVLKHISILLDDESTDAVDVGTLYEGKITFEDTPMTRQRLNELLKQTPSLPGESRGSLSQHL